MSATEQILGVRFFNGTVREVVDAICETGGLLVVPAAPALVNIQYDPGYREALVNADYVIADSGAMVLLWRAIAHCDITRISGLAYLQQLLQRPALHAPHATFLVLPDERAREKAIAYFRQRTFKIDPDDTYIAPLYASAAKGNDHGLGDPALLALIRAKRPAHIIVGIGGGTQEKLGYYLRQNCGYSPTIHCIGAALGFLTGDQRPIPPWADRLYLGWLLRLARDPARYLRRFWVAHELPGLIVKYREQLPPLTR